MAREGTAVLRPSAGARPGRTGHGVLRADARFARLPGPDYDLDATGIRTGAAPTLTIVGALLLVAAPFGAWLRVTRVAGEDAPAELVQEVTAVGLGGGWALLLLALLVLVLAPTRLAATRRSVRLVVAAATTVPVGVLLVRLQARIGEVAEDAVAQAGFHDLLAGVGWGAWAALLGVAAVVLAAFLGALAGHDVEEGPR